MKKAYLVTFTMTTRIVVDSDKNPEEDDDLREKCAEKARENIIGNGVEYYLCDENLDGIKEDTEMPYDEEYDYNGEYAVKG